MKGLLIRSVRKIFWCKQKQFLNCFVIHDLSNKHGCPGEKNKFPKSSQNKQEIRISKKKVTRDGMTVRIRPRIHKTWFFARSRMGPTFCWQVSSTWFLPLGRLRPGQELFWNKPHRVDDAMHNMNLRQKDDVHITWCVEHAERVLIQRFWLAGVNLVPDLAHDRRDVAENVWMLRYDVKYLQQDKYHLSIHCLQNTGAFWNSKEPDDSSGYLRDSAGEKEQGLIFGIIVLTQHERTLCRK